MNAVLDKTNIQRKKTKTAGNHLYPVRPCTLSLVKMNDLDRLGTSLAEAEKMLREGEKGVGHKLFHFLLLDYSWTTVADEKTKVAAHSSRVPVGWL